MANLIPKSTSTLEPPGKKIGVDPDSSTLLTTPYGALTAQDIGPSKHNINWLNGSYAGADIKVIAHLYGKVEKETSIAEIKDQAQFCRDIVNAANTFKTQDHPPGVLAGKKSGIVEANFTRICGNPSSRVLNVMKENLWNSYLLWALGSSLEGRHGPWETADGMAIEYESIAKSLEDKVKAMHKLNDTGSSTVTLESLQTISVQSYREKNAVRSLGKSYVSGYTRGPRTLGGSMIFTMIREHPLKRLILAMGDAKLYGDTIYDTYTSTLLPDQLPPIDLTIVFANEYGSISRMGIYGVEFLTDGMTLSSEDILTEVVMQFVARDIDIPSSVGMMRLSKIEKGIYDDKGMPVDGSSLYFANEDAYKKMLVTIGLRYGQKGR